MDKSMTPNKLPPLPEPCVLVDHEGREIECFSASDMRMYADAALRQSQSLPAGAVANFRDWFAIAFPVTDLEANDGDVTASSARHVARTAWCAALQADAREKGEGVVSDATAEAALDALDEACQELAKSRQTVVRVSWHGYSRQDRIDVIRAALATQPAQASEKDK